MIKKKLNYKKEKNQQNYKGKNNTNQLKEEL